MYHSVVLAVCLCWKRCNIAKKKEVRCRHRLRLFHIIISLCLTTRKHNQTTSTWNALFFVFLFSCDFVQIASRCVCLIDVNKVLGAAHCSRNDTLASFVGQYKREREQKYEVENDINFHMKMNRQTDGTPNTYNSIVRNWGSATFTAAKPNQRMPHARSSVVEQTNAMKSLSRALNDQTSNWNFVFFFLFRKVQSRKRILSCHRPSIISS